MTAWLLTYLLHSTLLIGAVALFSRFLGDRWLPVEEGLWRMAVLGGIVSASLQVGLGFEPLGGAWVLSSTASPQAAGASATNLLFQAPAMSQETTASAFSANWIYDMLPAVSGWLITGWLLVASMLILVLAVGQLKLERRLVGRRAIDQGRLAELLGRLVSKTATRISVRLSSSPTLQVPLAKGWWRHEICLPERVGTELGPAHQEIVLAHELAHLRRHDPLWLTLIRLVESLLFFQPLNRLARRRLQDLAEYQCDDWTVTNTGRPVVMAKCLANVAAWSLRRDHQVSAPALTRRGGGLERRVARLLRHRRPLPHQPRSGWFLAGVSLLLVVTALAAPGFSIAESAEERQPDPPAPIPAEEVETTDPPTPPAAPVPPVPPLTVEAVPSAREIEGIVWESLEAKRRALEVELREVERVLERQARTIEREARAVEREVAREMERLERIPLERIEAIELELQQKIELHELQIDRIEDLHQEARETLDRQRALQETELQRLREEREKLRSESGTTSREQNRDPD